jgi:hypothetical protein
MEVFNDHSGAQFNSLNYTDHMSQGKLGNKKLKSKQQIASHKLLYMSQERPFPQTMHASN